MSPFRYTHKHHYIILVSLGLLTLLVRWPFQGPYLYDGDPVAYFVGAESLLNTGTYFIDGKIPFWPIGTSITLAPFVWFFQSVLNMNGEYASFWHGFLFAYLTVAFIYLIGKRLLDMQTGIIAAVLFSLAESPFLHSINAASDLGAIAMLTGAILFMLRFLDNQSPWQLLLSMFLLGAAIVFRWNYIFFIPLLFIYLVGDKRIWAFTLVPSFWILSALGFLLGIIPQLITNYSHYQNPFILGYSELDISSQFSFSPIIWSLNFIRILYRVLFTWDFYSPLLAFVGLFGIVSLWNKLRRDVFWWFVPWIVLGAGSVVYFGVKPRLLIPIMPPLFLIGGHGVSVVFAVAKKQLRNTKIPPRLALWVLGFFGVLVFLPIFSRTLITAHGHHQEKIQMQKVFRWVGENSDPETLIITQSEYAGQNHDWQRAGWDIWASKRYSNRNMASLSHPEYWKENENTLLVINEFWFQGENMRLDDTRETGQRFDSLKVARNMELIQEFVGKSEPLFLKKLNMLSFYPIDFMVYRPRFQVWKSR